MRQDQVRPIRDVNFGFQPVRFDVLEFLFELPRVDHHAIGQDRFGLLVQHTARKEVEFVGHIRQDNRVTGVRAALITHNEIGFRREEIDDFSFAFVTPLRPDDDNSRHVFLSNLEPVRATK